jgi:adenylate cyclase
VSRPACVLAWTAGGKSHTAELTEGETILGRAPEPKGVVIDHERVSRTHAVVRPSGAAWTITDLGAANGTFVNGARLARDHPHTLADGDIVRLAGVEVTCRLVAPPAPPIVFEQEDVRGATSVLSLDDVRAIIGGGGAWIADLFSEAAEGLLSSPSLDAMLGTVLALVFKHLPAERGSVCLYEKDGGVLVHRASRTAKGVAEEPLRLSQTIVDRAVRDRQAFLYQRGLGANQESMSIVALEIRSAMCAPLVSGEKVVGLLYADTKNLLKPFDDQHLKVFSTLAKLSAVAVEEARLRDAIVREQAIRESLARYSGKAVVDRIMASTGGQMIVDEAEVSVVFADLVGFTSLAENLSPSEVTRVLNGVFDHLTRAVFECEGTLDKFIGDEVMAFFGAPLPQPDHAVRAVRAAMRLQEKLREYNAAHPDQKPLEMRIGINSGSVIVGDIGSLERKDYTVIGDTVNTAKRIEAFATGRGEIVIGPSTYEAVKACFRCEPLAPIELKGKRGALQAYRVVGDL